MINNLKKTIIDPSFVEELHETRIKAKPLKAISEISVSLFSNDFENCFNEIKEVLSVTGEIHDLDETISIIEKNHNKRWYKRLQSGLESIKSHRSALFQKLSVITDNLQESIVKRISLAMLNKSEIKQE